MTLRGTEALAGIGNSVHTEDWSNGGGEGSVPTRAPTPRPLRCFVVSV